MPSEIFLQLLERAAAAFGVDPGYWDIWGRHHATTMEAQQVILRAMGLDADDAKRLEHSLAAHTLREWERLLPPAVVARESAAVELPLSVPAGTTDGRARISVRREDGHTTEYEMSLNGRLDSNAR